MRSYSPLTVAALAVFGQLASALATPIFDSAESAQQPLGQQAIDGATYTLYEQSDEVCAAGGRQWTGWVNVSEQKKLFFCKPLPKPTPPSAAGFMYLPAQSTSKADAALQRVLRKSL